MIDDLLHPRHAHLRKLCAERGITIRRHGECWLLESTRVRLLVSDLRLVNSNDLNDVDQFVRRNET